MNSPAISVPALLSVDQVAGQLGMQARTVRRYVRDGKLKAVKIGKQYRIAASDLATLTGKPVTPEAPVPRHRHVEASTVVQIDAISPPDAQRVVNGLGGAIRGRDRNSDTPLRVDTVYDETRARLKVIITGSLASTSVLLQMIGHYTQ
ncbi:MAG: helix-turn-helix domain-containing protein [Pseudomonadota bacterium]